MRALGITLSGYFGCGNLGDDLLLLAAVENLRSLSPGATFFVRDHGQFHGDLGKDVIFTGIETILTNGVSSRPRRIVLYLIAIASTLRKSGWLVFAGGTVFHDFDGGRSLVVQALTCLVARALGVRIAAIGVGIGDMRSLPSRVLLAVIERCCALFLVRDQASFNRSSRAELTEDLVFSLADQFRHSRAQASARKLAVTVYPPACSPAKLAAMSAALREAEQTGFEIVFFVFHETTLIADDLSIINRLSAMTHGRTEIRRLRADPDDIARAFADISIVFGMRLHSLVIAAMLCLPFVGLAHATKIRELCRRFDAPCVDDPTQLMGALISISRMEVAHKLRERTLRAKIDSTRNFERLSTLSSQSASEVR